MDNTDNTPGTKIDKSGFQARVIGYSWKPDRNICPALLSAVERYAPPSRDAAHTICFKSHWVLDYSYTYDGLYRVRTKSSPWRGRHPQTAHLYPPGTRYWENTYQKKHALSHISYLIFAGASQAGLSGFIEKRFGYARFLDPSGILGEYIQKMAAIGQNDGTSGYWPASARLSEIFSLLLRARHVKAETYNIEPINVPPAKPDLAEIVGQFLRQNSSRKVKLEEIASYIHMSASSLSHRYHEETGETPMKTLARIRVNLAKSFLMKGYSLKTIAEQLGFNDAFHLSKSFKRIEGTSPRRFLKENQGKRA